MNIGKFNEYKDYIGSIELIDGELHGKILDIEDLVTYESDNIEGLRREFHLAVDDYIEMKIYADQVKEEMKEKGEKENETDWTK